MYGYAWLMSFKSLLKLCLLLCMFGDFAASSVCRASGSPTDPPPPADDSSSSNPASSSPASGESAEPSTSYLLPWEDEQPKQLPANYEAIKASILQMDNNQLQTALAVAIAAEDYALASRYAVYTYTPLMMIFA